MRHALALVWVAPERDQPGSSTGDSVSRSGNGHPTPSTILVVEDEVLIRLAVSDFLRECGYRVLESSNGEEAQSIIRSSEPVEILFSDIDLGRGIDGLELARWVRENYPAVRIVLTSGIARMTQEAAGLCDGPLLEKPYPFPVLKEHIQNLLSAFGRQRG